MPTSFQKNQVLKVALISKLHVQKLFSKTLGTCHARLDTFPRGIWIPSASLSMASFTFKLQHFNVMLSLGLLTHSPLLASTSHRGAGTHGDPMSPPIFDKIFIVHFNHLVDSKDFPLINIEFHVLSLSNLKSFLRP